MLNRLVELSLRYKFLIVMLFGIVAFLGYRAVRDVPIDAFPDVTLVGVADSVTAGGALPPPSVRTSMALTQASPTRPVKPRLSVASVVTMTVRSATVLTGTE